MEVTFGTFFPLCHRQYNSETGRLWLLNGTASARAERHFTVAKAELYIYFPGGVICYTVIGAPTMVYKIVVQLFNAVQFEKPSLASG